MPSAARCLAFVAALLIPASGMAADAQPDTAAAPATRAEAWRRLRAEKSTRLHAYVPKAVEKFSVRFEDEIIPRLTTPRSGVFPFVGRITSGGGFALGLDDWLTQTHRWLGTGIGIGAFALGIFALKRPEQDRGTAMITGLSVLTAAIIVQGWFGGALVHGIDHLNW